MMKYNNSTRLTICLFHDQHPGTVEREEDLAGGDLVALNRDQVNLLLQPAPLGQRLPQHLLVVISGYFHQVGHLASE